MDDYLPPIDESAAFIQEIDPSKPLPVDIEALQAIKFESEDPDESARTYKEEGNYNFKKGDFKVARNNYTEGLKCKGVTDKSMIVQLHTNRAAAEFRLGNFGSCNRDCKRALQLEPGCYKAHLRSAQSLLALEKFSECEEKCEQALLLFPDDKDLLRLSAKANEEAQRRSGEQRRKQLQQRQQKLQQQREANDLEAALKQRGIRRAAATSQLEMPADAKLCLQPPDAKLLLPVLLLYPEFGQTDLLHAVHEHTTVQDVLRTVLQQQPAWDEACCYTESAVAAFAAVPDPKLREDGEGRRMRKLQMDDTLASVLQSGTLLVGDVLLITVLSTKSQKFYEKWRAQQEFV